jgi:hypothetical protein
MTTWCKFSLLFFSITCYAMLLEPQKKYLSGSQLKTMNFLLYGYHLKSILQPQLISPLTYYTNEYHKYVQQVMIAHDSSFEIEELSDASSKIFAQEEKDSDDQDCPYIIELDNEREKFSCKYCDKLYSRKSSFYHHLNRCQQFKAKCCPDCREILKENV